jgi:riboflavin synthase
MFSGIVEGRGRVIEHRVIEGGGVRMGVAPDFSVAELSLGDSVAHNGVCLTVSERDPAAHVYWVDLAAETLHRTTLGHAAVGQVLNLERSITLATRLGGHVVVGHVDGTATLIEAKPRANGFDLRFEVSPELLRMIIPQGSVAVDGVALTVAARDAVSFSVHIIPHTWAVTTLSQCKTGSHANIEIDLIARYVAGMLSFSGGLGDSPEHWWNQLLPQREK